MTWVATDPVVGSDPLTHSGGSTPGAAVTAVYDATYRRIGVTVNGLNTSLSDIIIYRVEDGVRTPLRSAEPANASGGVAFAYDYEFPLGKAVTYAVDDSAVAPSAPITMASTIPVLRSPFLPALNRTVRMAVKPHGKKLLRPQQTVSILGSSFPVVRSGTLQAESGTMLFYTATDAEAAELLALLSQSVVQVHVPNTRFGTRYVSLGDVSERDATEYADGSPSSKYSWWQADYQVVARPVGKPFGDPNATWEAVRDRHATWAEVKATYVTWLDLLRGVVE